MKYKNLDTDYEILRPLTPAAIMKKVDAERSHVQPAKPVGQPAKPRNAYSDWCMPKQPSGYIKSKDNDCL